jgi:PPP family 3-phenylpropionic acid transporter
MPRWKFHYGWLRGCGSAAFVVGLVMSGQAIGHFGIVVIVWLNAALLLAASPVALGVPQLLASGGHSRATAGQARGVLALLRLPLYRKMVLLAALILGSHAMHDSFAMIRWSRAGISPGTSGILWSLSVAAEVVVFVVVGRPLLDRIGPAGAAVLSAGAGVVRWAVMAETAWLPALALIEPLHGLTFALLHLTCMRLLAQCVPRHLEATALTIYGTVGIGVATALLTLACGPIVERFGAHGFWAMAALCAAALPLARTLREPTADPG